MAAPTSILRNNGGNAAADTMTSEKEIHWDKSVRRKPNKRLRSAWIKTSDFKEAARRFKEKHPRGRKVSADGPLARNKLGVFNPKTPPRICKEQMTKRELDWRRNLQTGDGVRILSLTKKQWYMGTIEDIEWEEPEGEFLTVSYDGGNSKMLQRWNTSELMMPSTLTHHIGFTFEESGGEDSD